MTHYVPKSQPVRSWVKGTLLVLWVSLGLLVGNVIISEVPSAAASTFVSFTGSTWELKKQPRSPHPTRDVLTFEVLPSPGITATSTFTEPTISAVPPAVFQVGKNDLALLYLENSLLYRFDIEQQQSRIIAQVPLGIIMSLSPNGQYLVYYGNGTSAHLLNILTGETTTLLDPKSRYFPSVWNQQNQVMIQQYHGNSECREVGWFDPSEKNLHLYDQNAGINLECVSAAAWSNQGDRIALIRPNQKHGGYLGFGVQVLEVTGGKPTYLEQPNPTLAAATSLDWSPDDRWIAASLAEETPQFHQRVSLIRANGGESRAITLNQMGQAEAPIWGPDQILYYGITGAETQADGLYRYTPANQTSLPLASGSNLRPVDVSPDGEFLLYQDGPQMVNAVFRRYLPLKLFSLQAQQIISITDGQASFVGWLTGPDRRPAWRTHGPGGRVDALAFEAEDHYWLAASIKGQTSVIEQAGLTRRIYTSTHGLVPSYRINTIVLDPAGPKWFGTDAGVSEFDGQNWRTFTTTHGLVSNRINAIAIDPEGHKWFGTDAGVSEFDGQNWRTFTTTHGLALPWVNAIVIGLDGAKWFATQGGGISRFDGAVWTTFTAADGLTSNMVYDLTFDRSGQLWAGTSGGVNKFDGTSWTPYTTLDGLLADRVSRVTIAPNGHKWFGYNQDEVNTTLTEFDDSRWQPASPALPLVTTALFTSTVPFTIYDDSPRLIDDETGRYYTVGLVNGVRKTLLLSLPDGRLLATYDLVGKMALDSANGWLYIDQDDNQGLAVFNTHTDSLQTVIRLPAGQRHYSGLPAPQADPAAGRVLAFRDNVVYIAEPKTGSIIETFAPGVIKSFEEREIAPIEYANYDPASRVLYLDMLEYASGYEAYTIVTYNLASGPEITRRINASRSFNIFTAAGYALYGGTTYDCRAVLCTVSRSLWQGDLPRLQLTGFPYHDTGRFALDPTRQHLYEVTDTHLRLYDLETMALIQHQPHAFRGQFARYHPSTDELQFWVGDRLESWPVSALQPLSPEPLIASPVPTASLQSLVISPNWPTDQTLFGLWPELSEDGSSMWGCGVTSRPYLSHDGGQTWSQTRQGLPNRCLLPTPLAVSPDYVHDQTIFAGILGLGVFKSTDGGQLWLPAGAGITHLNMAEIIISPGFVRDKTVFALAATIGGNRPDTLYRTRDGGQTWQSLNLPLTADLAQYLIAVVVSPDFEYDQTLLIVLGGQEPQLYLSQNGGDQWKLVGELPTGVRRLWVAPLFAKWHTLFAATDQQPGEQQLYRSTDGGKSWQTVLTSPVAVRQVTFAYNIEQNRPGFALNDQLYHSPDGGLTWQEVELPSPINPVTLLISPNFAQDQSLFVGTNQGKVLSLKINK